MPKLSVEQQRKIVQSLNAPQKMALAEYKVLGKQSGEGFWDSLKSVAAAIGPTVVKDLLIPLVKSRYGAGFVGFKTPSKPPKSKYGLGYKLPGQGLKKKPKKKAPKIYQKKK